MTSGIWYGNRLVIIDNTLASVIPHFRWASAYSRNAFLWKIHEYINYNFKLDQMIFSFVESFISPLPSFIFPFPAWGGKCSIGGIVPNTAFIFRAFVAAPRTQSYLCIFSSFCLALNFNIQVVNSLCDSISWNFLSKISLWKKNSCLLTPFQFLPSFRPLHIHAYSQTSVYEDVYSPSPPLHVCLMKWI